MELARISYECKDWMTCYWAAMKCISITNRQLSYISDGSCWGCEPHDLAAISSYNLNLFSEALMHGIDALQMSPNNERLRSNVELFKKKVARRR